MEANPSEGNDPAKPAATTDRARSSASSSPQTRRPLLTYLILGGACALAVWAVSALLPRGSLGASDNPPPQKPIVTPTPATRPQVDLVFALDTTGSMSSLLDGAKRKIWEIARFIAKGQPAPELRIGLIAYRDIGDEYVTKFFDLTFDLDSVYQNLLSLSAGGGGDTPEHVAKALNDAVYRTSFSNNRNTLKIIYLVGDAPPHTDYNDGYDFRAIARQARERGIRINTVRCGSDEDTRMAWTEIANLTGGEFASIDQGGGMVDTHTPYDSELARLNRSLTDTALPYGSVDKRNSALSKARKSLDAPLAAQAERAGFFGLAKNGGKAAAVSDFDLLDDLSNKNVELSRVEKDALPEAMQALSAEERGHFIATKKQERAEILNQINALSTQRDAFLRNNAAAPASGFDGKLRETLKKQAKDIHVAY
jgi:Mg-chelatase subunit ChlD